MAQIQWKSHRMLLFPAGFRGDVILFLTLLAMACDALDLERSL